MNVGITNGYNSLIDKKLSIKFAQNVERSLECSLLWYKHNTRVQTKKLLEIWFSVAVS